MNTASLKKCAVPHRVPTSHSQTREQALCGEHTHGTPKEVLHTPPAHVCGILGGHAVRKALGQQVAAHQTQQAALVSLRVINLQPQAAG
jgi:hypothetical protein